MTKPQAYHVHIQVRAAGRFADYTVNAPSWEAACQKALAIFRDELPRNAKHLARWASCSC